jgi:hypothetical protein
MVIKMSNLTYGVVVGNVFYSGRMTRSLGSDQPNGIYSMDMSIDDFESSLTPADVSDATKAFRKYNTMAVIRGVTFKDCIVPSNPVIYPTIPLKVIDATYDDFEEVDVVKFSANGYYFLQSVETQQTYALMDLKAGLEAKPNKEPSYYKGSSPEAKIAYILHLAEIKREEDRLKQEAADIARKAQQKPIDSIRSMMVEVGAEVYNVKQTNRGFEVSWGFDRHRLTTIFDKDLKVANAGYCVNGNDRVLSGRSIVNLLKDGIRQGEHIHLTLSASGNWGDDVDHWDHEDDDFDN